MSKKNKIIISITILIFITLSSFTYSITTWSVDPNYTIKFTGSKAEGSFSGLQGIIAFDDNDLANSKIDVTVAANTIHTGSDLKDKHAKEGSWLDAGRYPLIRFTSTGFVRAGNDYMVSGILELHGVKKQIQIPFAFANAGNKATFTGNFTLNRKDYGIDGNMFGFAVGKEFNITVRLPVNKAL